MPLIERHGGRYLTKAGTHEMLGTFTATLVPEASTWVMMLLGFAGLGFAGYHRAKSGQKTSSAA
jgi:PEP-CTERM motif